MTAVGGSWPDDAALADHEDLMMTAFGDRSIFSLEDIFLDIKDPDVSALVPDSPRPSPAASLNMHPSSSAAATFSGDAATASDVLPEGLLCDDADATQLEWLSNFCEESYSSDGLRFVPCAGAAVLATNAAAAAAAAADKDQKPTPSEVPPEMIDQWLIFRSSSPVSVLEHGIFPLCGRSSSSPTSSAGSAPNAAAAAAPWSPPEPVSVPARSRSKRPRPPSCPVRAPIVIALPPSPAADADAAALPAAADCAPAEPEGESEFPGETQTKKKRRKKKPKKEEAAAEEEEEGEAAATTSCAAAGVTARKCMHCEVTKTPQWRAGPLGPKTLCNACGVRYKSGRLFPEYRPAASPTFVPAVHSNSHKKVVEMRNRVGHAAPPPDAGPRRLDLAAKSCELLDYLRRRELRAADLPTVISAHSDTTCRPPPCPSSSDEEGDDGAPRATDAQSLMID
ncbi:uncharacterized protein LOC144700288 [Wolffia australiana]